MTATAPVTYSPPAGIYSTPQSVTLSTETAGASIYYTVDGSEPTVDIVASTAVVSTSPSIAWGFTATASHGIYFGEYKPADQSGRVYKSIDGGSTWALQSASPTAKWRGIALSPSGVVFFGRKDGGVFRTSNGGTSFEATALPSAIGNYNALICTTSGTFLAGQYGSGSTKSVYRSTDNGDTYSIVLTGISSVCMGQDRNGGLYVAGENASVYYSSDDGLTWSAIAGTTGWTVYTGSQNTSIQYPSESLTTPLYFAKEGGGVYEALDGQLTLFAAFGTATEWRAMSLARGGLLVSQYSAPGFTNAIKGQNGIGGTYAIPWDNSSLITIFGSGDRLFLGKYLSATQLVEAIFSQTYAGTLYSAPLTISEPMTVKAIAVKSGLDDSAVTSSQYAFRPGEFIIPSFKVRLYNDSAFRTDLKTYDISSQAIDIPDDGIHRHVCVSRIDETIAITLKTHEQEDEINFSNVIPLWQVARFGTYIHQINYNNAGDGLSSKHELMHHRTEPYRLTVDTSFSVTLTGRALAMTAADVFFGHRMVPVLAYSSVTDMATDWYHVGGVWTRTVYDSGILWPNTTYDNGTDLVTIGNNKWGVVFVYRSIGDNKEIFYVRGGSEETTKEKARLIPVPVEPDLVQWHSMLVGKILFQAAASTGEFEPYSTAAFIRSQVPSIALDDLTDVTVAGAEAGAFLQKNLANEWVGNQLVWDDMRHLSNIKIIGTDKPEYVTFKTDFLALEFTVGDMAWCDSEQMPHAWASTPIRPHIHVCTGASGGTGNMVWEIIIASRPASSGVWSSSQTITKTWTGTLVAWGTTVIDMWDDPGVTLVNMGTSVIMKIRLRLVSKTFTGDVYLDAFDSHIQIKRAGTINEFGQV